MTHALRAYQEAAADFLYERDRAMILASVGAGKTAIALTAMWDMLNDGHVRRWLVIAPKRVAVEVWPAERNLWAWGVDMSRATGTAEQREQGFAAPSRIVVMNYDCVQWLEPRHLETIDGVVFDELTKLKNPSGKRFKHLFGLLDKAGVTIRWGLTGSFTSNGLEDVFGQCKIIDQRMLGRSKGAFLQQYFYCTNKDYGLWTPYAQSLSEVMKKIRPHTFTLENDEYKDMLPPLHIVEVSCDMADRTPYEKMKHDMLVEVEGETITAMTAGVLAGKLRQGACGWFYGTKEDNIRKPYWFSKHKFERLDEILEENQYANTVVFYEFREEFDELRRRYPHAVSIDTHDAIRRWNAGELELLLAHPGSAGHGLNLQYGGHHMVFLTAPWSLELYEQAIGRLHRGGQTRPVWVYILQTKNTIDSRVFAVLHDRRKLSDIAVEELKK